jgi:phosphoribosylformylglycinamidine synthase subunit PurL
MRAYPHTRIGVVDTENRALDVQSEFGIGLDELRTAHEGTLPKHFG